MAVNAVFTRVAADEHVKKMWISVDKPIDTVENSLYPVIHHCQLPAFSFASAYPNSLSQRRLKLNQPVVKGVLPSPFKQVSL